MDKLLQKLQQAKEKIREDLKAVAYFEPEREDEIEFLRRRV